MGLNSNPSLSLTRDVTSGCLLILPIVPDRLAKELKEKINGKRFEYLMSDDYKPEEIAKEISEEIVTEISTEDMELVIPFENTELSEETTEENN